MDTRARPDASAAVPGGPEPPDEAARVDALRQLGVLDTPPEPAFDDLARLAARICATPIALIGFVAEERQWFKARFGFDAAEIPRSHSLCAQTILGTEALVVPDATADPRVAALPQVGPGLKFYAGVPLRTADGYGVGTLCVLDVAPRVLGADQMAALFALGREVMVHLTERARLRETEARGRAVEGGMLAGLLTLDEEGRITSANRAAAQIFERSGDEMIGRSLVTVLAPLPGGRAVAEMLADAAGRVTEWQGKRGNGEVFPFELSLFEFQECGKRCLGASIRDLTALREADRLKKEFVSTVSHELRTPLTSIRGSLTLLAAGVLGELPDEAAEVVSIAERNCTRLITLINDLLDLERLEAGRLELSLATVSVASLLSQAADTVRDQAAASRITLQVAPTSDWVTGDESRLVQVLVNLLSNAVKFSAPGSEVHVELGRRGRHVLVEIIDRGRGVPARLQATIFQRFAQAETSDSRTKGGTGVGLAISRGIVELHGGSIGVTSEEGQGSTFWFELPGARAPHPGYDDSWLTAIDGAGEPLDVLLVDDDEALLGVLSRQLTQEGLRVGVATTARDAISRTISSPPRALVLDLVLPDGNGRLVVEACRRNPVVATMPLLVYTGRDVGAEERDSLRLGKTRFLTKSRASDAEVSAAVLELLRPA